MHHERIAAKAVAEGPDATARLEERSDTVAALRRALEEAQERADTARVLLGLSDALAGIATTDEMAARLAAAVPEVIDCDRAAVVLGDPDTATARVVAAHGYPPDDEAALRTTVLPFPRHRHGAGSDRQPDVVLALARQGAVATTSTPLVVSGELAGWVLAAVSRDPDRLRRPEVAERLHGLAVQAAIALRNGRLLDQIRHQALYDGLTDLPNRVLILDRAEQMLSRARRRGVPAAALFIDLDGFKDVNDTFGHRAGDQLLRSVARRLAGALRESDTLGRLGGDEFLVLADGSVDDGPETVAQRLIDVLREPFRVEGANGAELTVGASVGIAAGDRQSAEDLLRDADVALYAAKAAGRNRFAVFRPEMQQAVRDRLELESELRQALTAGQFFLVYQPIVDLTDMSVSGVEALLRWHHPSKGVVPAEEVVPLLEESAVIVDVGRWVMSEACRQTAAWQAEGHRLGISVNVSARQLRAPGFVEDLTRALESNRLDPSTLTLEVTEATIRSGPDAEDRLRAVKAGGVRIAIDNFGTGWSSMTYLSRRTVDALKIDHSFVVAGATSPEAQAVVRAVVALGRSMGLETLAQGIEHEDQVRYLQDHQFAGGQGFLFSRPLEAAELLAYLRRARAVERRHRRPAGQDVRRAG